MSKEFVFLYPIPEYMEAAIGSYGRHSPAFRRRWKTSLNASIDQRYRQNDFGINFVIFDGHTTSDVVDIRPTDRVIEAGVDFATHIKKQPDGSHIYPDPGRVLDVLTGVTELRVGGFHLWDCVEKTTIAAYERGIDVLVDEDLTEIFGLVMRRSSFRPDTYPTFKPRSMGKVEFELFMMPRKGRPWLWQDF